MGSELEPSGGLRFAYPDNGVEQLVSYHYSVNVPIVGVAAGQWNYDVSSPTDGYFIHENSQVQVNVGDTVYYWVNVITTDGLGYSQTGLKWTVTGATTTTQVPTTTTAEPEPEPTTTTTQAQTTTTKDTNTGGGSVDPVTQPPSSGGNTVVVDAGCSSYPCASGCDSSAAPCNGLIFEELWDDLNMERWQHEITMGGGGNWEFEYYGNNRSNSYVRDNTLFIKPTLTSDNYGEAFLTSGTLDLWGASPADQCTGNGFYGCSRSGNPSNLINPIQSARLRTVNSFSCKYCRVEVEAKLPSGDWIWPAIWMLPKSNRYGQWPAAGEFHKYILDWNENGATFYLDDQEVLKVDPGSDGFWSFGEFEAGNPGIDNPWENSDDYMTPFNQEFYILLNVAVDGTNGYFPDGWTNGNGPKPWLNNSPTAFKDFWDAR